MHTRQTMRHWTVGTLAGAMLLGGMLAQTAPAEPAAPMEALAQMPVKEVTVFKDGHALVLHEGTMPTDADGNVVLDYLPVPVLGTFWPYSIDKTVKLVSTVASSRKVLVERTALNVRALIEANVGAEVFITEIPFATSGSEAKPLIYEATILGVPEQSGKEQEANDPPNSGDKLPIKGNVVLLKTLAGTKVANIERIADVTFKKDHKPLLADEELRNLVTMKLAWPGDKPQPKANVGLMYVQKGLRWIPSYKIEIDGQGNANVILQATLINELTDLKDATANLVIGVPSFAFKDTVDPMALHQTLATLSPYFASGSAVGNNLSNSQMITLNSQYAGQPGEGEPRQVQPGAPMDLGPEVAGSGKSEDLFIFTVKHVTMKKGQRMALPVAQFPLAYKDIYTLDVPFAPPLEIRRGVNNAQEAEVAKLLAAPKAIHKIRLSNKSDFPLTTAPAMIVKDSRVLAQGLMTYTQIGSETDLELTTALDIRVKKNDKETKRTPNAATVDRISLTKIELDGTVAISSFAGKAVEIEVTRHVLGNLNTADNDGKVEMINVFENNDYIPAGQVYPTWWNYYSWPTWWSRYNGIGKVTWNVKLEPGKSIELHYAWNYYNQ